MTIPPNSPIHANREILISLRLIGTDGGWIDRVRDLGGPPGFAVCRTTCGADAVQRVELGGLAAAIVADPRPADALTVVRMIRSVDRRLPCWLITERASRQALEAALSLEVVSVITHPGELNRLEGALMRYSL